MLPKNQVLSERGLQRSKELTGQKKIPQDPSLTQNTFFAPKLRLNFERNSTFLSSNRTASFLSSNSALLHIEICVKREE